MPFELNPLLQRQRRLASHLGLALLVLSPLFFWRALEDAFVLPQRLAALVGLGLAFVGLRAQAFSRSRLLWTALLYFSWRLFSHSQAVLSGPAEFGPALNLSWLLEQILPLGVLLLAAHAGRDPDWQARAWRLTGWSAGLVSFYALLLLWGLDPWDKGAVDMGFLQRAHGSLGNPDFLAGYLVLTLPGLALAWAAAQGLSGRQQALRLGLFAMVALAFLLTHVRGAWLASGVAVPLAFFAAPLTVKWRRAAVLALMMLALLAAFSLPSRLNPAGESPWSRLRAAWSGDGAWAGRRFMARVGWNLAKAHPLTGVGPGRFQDAYLEEEGRLLGLAAYAHEPYRFTADIHDDWLQVLAESGWVGLGLFVGVFGMAWRSAWRRRSTLGAALVGLLAAFAVQALFHFPLGIQGSALLFWGALGLCAAWEAEEQGSFDAPVNWAWLSLPVALALALTVRQSLGSAALNSGTVLRDAGRTEAAAALFQRAAQLWPDDTRAWMRLGLAQDALGQGEASVGSFEKAVKVLPSLPEGWSNLGLALGKMGQLPSAQAASEQALSLNPRSAEAWSNLAKLRYLQGDTKGALADLQGGLGQAGPSPLLYFNLGAVQLNQGHKQEAREAFEQCLRLKPDHTEAKRLLLDLGHAR